MKQCPICQSVAFDDATTCYGCLHEFADDEAASIPTAPLENNVATPIEAPPSFLIQIKPERERSGQTSWTCKVDLVPA